MLLAAVLAGISLALAAEEVITKPTPGNEYVSFSGKYLFIYNKATVVLIVFKFT